MSHLLWSRTAAAVSAASSSKPGRRRRSPVLHRSALLGVALVALVGCAATIEGSAHVDPAGIRTTSTSTPRTISTKSQTRTTRTSTSPTASSTSRSSSTESPSTSSQASTSSSTTGPTSATTGDTTSSGTASTSFTGNPDNIALTEPGTSLAYGQTATLPVTYVDSQGVFTFEGVTVTQGTEADWAALGVDQSDAQGETPWYLKAHITQKSGGDFAYSSIDSDLVALSADGDYIDVVYAEDDENPLCPYVYPGSDFTVGSSYDACVVLSVNNGEQVGSVEFQSSSYDYDTDPYAKNPVVWK